MASCSDNAFNWMTKAMKHRYERKVHTLGPDKKDESQTKALNRIITWVHTGNESIITCEAYSRHAEIIDNDLGLKDAKSLSTPITKIEVEANDELLDEYQATRYKSLTARANHVVADRPGIQLVCREFSTYMVKPTKSSWEKRQRLGKYLKGKIRFVHQYAKFDKKWSMITYTVANLAGDKTSRKSTSGGYISIGIHFIESWSKIQAIIALSSAESELYAAVTATTGCLGIKSVAEDFNIEIDAAVMAAA